MFTFIFIANLIVCLILTGLIWTIQIVHYPLFLEVGEETFKRYQIKHQQKITFLVAPLMVAELVFSFVWLMFFYKDALALAVLQFVLVIGIWLSTFLIQMPLHGKLNKGYNSFIIKKLVNSNWIRTMLWTMRCVLLIGVLMNYY